MTDAESIQAQLSQLMVRVDEHMGALTVKVEAHIRTLMAKFDDDIGALTAKVGAVEARLPSSLVSVKAAAKFEGVCTDTIYRKVKAGELPYTRTGRAIRIDISKLRRPA